MFKRDTVEDTTSLCYIVVSLVSKSPCGGGNKALRAELSFVIKSC